MTKKGIAKTIIFYEIIGFGIVILFLFADEVFDLPHHIFGVPATPINWVESFFEASLTLVLGVFTVLLTWRLLNRIKYLEGFLPVCLFCKKIRVDDEWTPIETFISEHSAAEFSHGLCPECARKHYGDFVQEDEKSKAGVRAK